MNELYFAIGTAIFSILFAWYTYLKVKKVSPGTDEMKEISDSIYKGAITFLNNEYKVLVVFVAVVFGVIWYFVGWKTAISFLVGAFLSALAGNLGMRVATRANARTAEASKKSLNDGLKVAFSAGSVMGFLIVGFGVLGISLLYMIFKDTNVIYGFSLGASSIALFARVGGGIYTKAADVGADLVGKIEAGVPEDDPRNPAVIADNVGDNVGDVAGMGADLYESYVGAIIASMALGGVMFGMRGVVLPLTIASIGILSSILGTFFVSSNKNAQSALNRGVMSSTIIMIIASYFAVRYGIGDIKVFYSVLAGLISGVIIGYATIYFTSYDYKPTKLVAKSATTGSATNIITGLSMGMLSTAVPVLTIGVAIILAYYLSGIYGIAMAGVGMLSTLGITLATDAYGPVADNAAGISEMAHLGHEIRERTESLDAVGNTTAAMGKGFAIGSAALTALSLFVVYSQAIEKLTGHALSISLTNPNTLVGLFIGGLLPFVFTGLTLNSVGRAASKMVDEVRRQFRHLEGILEGKRKPDYDRCISISTKAAIREMILPGVIAILTPIVVGLLMGPEALGGLLGGSIVTGFLLAIFMANAGGSWDNAKKYIESGKYGGKGSAAHKASVVGDTVGDPFKDTSGPSLNILIKLMTIVSVVFAALFV